MNKYKTLAVNTMIFAVGSFGSKILQLLLNRLYTSNIPSEMMNTKDLVEITANFLIPIFTVSIAESVIRFGLGRDNDKREVFTGAVVVELFGLALLLLCAPLLGVPAYMKGYLLLLIVYIITSSFRQLCSQFIRARGLLKLFSLDGILCCLSLFLFNVLFISILNLGVRGFFLSVILSDFCSGVFLCLVAGIPRYFSLRYLNPDLIRSMIRFSAPLIPTAVRWIFTGFSDRYFIQLLDGPAGLVGKSAAGVYSAASKVPNLLSMVSMVFYQAWNISAITENDSEDRSQFYKLIFGSYQSLMFVGSAMLIALVQPLSAVLISHRNDAAYAAAFRYTPLLVVAVLLMCFNQFFSSIYTATKHTKNSFWTSLVAAVTNLLLNLLLIPRYGVYGAIVATVLSYLICYVIRVFDARRYVPFPVAHGKTLLNLLILTGMSWAVSSETASYPVYLVCGVLLTLALNYEAILKTAAKLLHRS